MRLLALALVLVAPAADAALVKYEYTGAEYDFVADPSDPSVGANPWVDRTQNFVSGSFLLDTDLIAGGDHSNGSFMISKENPECSFECDVPVIDWQFFDGYYAESWATWSVSAVFWFNTDANGDLSWWHIVLLDDFHELIVSSDGDTRHYPICGNFEPKESPCVSASQAGTWVQVPVPEPAAWGILVAGLFAVFRLRRYRAS
jgi:hypothetical protein